jgi:ribosome modulation factor
MQVNKREVVEKVRRTAAAWRMEPRRQEGRRAAANGARADENPYPPDTESHWEWLQGWREGGGRYEQ